MAAAAVEEGGGGGGGGAVARIFVGGISEGVATADLEAMFASVGRVAGVEFVRTNGRSFAYVDFHCPSDKALAKLFSTYNGCKWKGGKIRLEKAKEHYLTRLKREWRKCQQVLMWRARRRSSSRIRLFSIVRRLTSTSQN